MGHRQGGGAALTRVAAGTTSSATVDPARERRNGRIRTAARCLIAIYRTCCARSGRGMGVARMRHDRDPYGDHQ